MMSNTHFSNDPTLNPLNAASHAVAQRIGHISKGSSKDTSKLQVPNQDVPLFGSDEWNQKYACAQAKLVPPNQDIPLGDQLGGNGFIPGHDNLFRLSNGAILDFKSRKVVFDPNSRSKEYWGNPNEVISFGMTQAYESPRKEFEELIARATSKNGSLDHIASNDDFSDQLDPRSAQYWIWAEEEAQKMMSSMSDEQKKMIADFEHHFPKSRLVEESKRAHANGTIL